MLLALPMAPFSWPVAAKLFALMNFAASIALFWAGSRLVHEIIGGMLNPLNWFWVVVASTIGGISGAIFTGQTSVFITAAGALALVGCRTHRTWLTVVGLVVATAKPQLSAPLLLFIALFEPGERRAVLIAMIIVAAVSFYAMAVDPHPLRNYLGSVHAYTALKVNNPFELIGAAPLLLRLGVEPSLVPIVGVASLIVILVTAAWLLRYSGQRFSANSTAIMFVVFSTGLAQPVHGYDLCAYAIGVALISTLPYISQLALIIPAVVLWRPDVVARPITSIASKNLIAACAWFGLFAGTIIMATVTHEARDLPLEP
jgi:hypothetical protein